MTSDSLSPHPIPPDNVSAARVGRTAQILVIIVATLLHGIFLSKAKPLQSANDRSRWCTVWSLVNRGTFQIDEIRQRPGWDTIDMVYVDGHFYSTKPPLLTTVVAGITWCVQRVTGWTLADQTQAVTFMVLLLVNVLPFAVSLVAWMAILEQISDQPWTRLFSMLIAAFGTLLTPFLMTLNNHSVAAASTMVALYALLEILRDDQNRNAIWPYSLCGLAVGWTVCNELPAGCLGVMVLVLAYRRSPSKTREYFLAAAVLPVLALMVTNIVATGSWKPVYADYGTDKYRFVVDGVPSYWMQPQGVDRNLDSPWMYFLHCTIGHHGLFSLTPIAVFSLISWVTCARLRDRRLRTLMMLGAATTVIVIAFYLTRTQNYNYGGVSCGLRWALWLTPLWLVAMVPVMDACAGFKRGQVLAVLLVAGSMYSAWQPIDNPWRQPWLFQWMEARGWIDYYEEQPPLAKPLWTWFSSLPETAEGDTAWIEFTVLKPGIASCFVRLLGRTVQKETPDERFELEIRETSEDGATPARVRTLSINTKKFREGAAPAEFLRWLQPDVALAHQQSDLAFVRGLPRKVPFHARAIRYLKTPLRPEALKCQLAAAHVSFAVDEEDPPLNYRCDTWLTDDVPFGVAQVEFHVSQPDTNAVLFHERWTVHDCWPKVLPFKRP